MYAFTHQEERARAHYHQAIAYYQKLGIDYMARAVQTNIELTLPRAD
jgi:hypothetical protein